MLRRRWVMIGSMAATVASGLMASAAPVQDDTEKQLAFRYLNSGDAQDLKQDQEVTQQETKQNQVDIEVTATEAGDAAEVPTDAHSPNYFLGIRLKSITGDLANYLDSIDGILVDAVLPDSPAEASKLQVGDILLAIDDKGLAGPASLLAHMQSVRKDDAGNVVPLSLKVLRNGKTLDIQITPAIRPESQVSVTDVSPGVTEHSLDSFERKSPEEILQMLTKVQGSSLKGINVFRFGVPSAVWHPAPQQEGAATTGNWQMKVMKTVDGKETEISIVRENGAPGKITVTRDGETKAYTEKEIDEMPKDVQLTVKELLSTNTPPPNNQRIRIEVERESSSKSSEPAKVEETHTPRRTESRITIVGPKGVLNVGELMNEEVAQKYRAMAQEMAERAQQSAQQSIEWTRNAAAMPTDIKELREQVEALRAEIKELRSQLQKSKD